MTREAYLDELDRELRFLAAAERQEIVREFSSHIDEAMARNPGFPEDELIERLPPPEVNRGNCTGNSMEYNESRYGQWMRTFMWCLVPVFHAVFQATGMMIQNQSWN
ncbi:MAG: hypothetical protein ABIJ86_11720 [Spirochaetota bacterium]